VSGYYSRISNNFNRISMLEGRRAFSI